METPPQARQQCIEARAAQSADFAPGPNQTMRDVFGEMDDWIFRLGIWEFLLDPVSRRWFYLDFAHDEYVDTGYRAGEVVFELADVAFTPLPRRAAEGPRCPGCGVMVQAGWAFCGECGASVAARFCAECGAPVKPGWEFCGECGSPVLRA
jgi:hypothetical protein